MYIIIAGAGTIGQDIIKILVDNKHNVVVIDIQIAACQTVHTETGALAICGNATDLSILQQAGAKNADLLLCLTRLDSDNIACALLGRSLGIPRVIARLHNPHYEDSYKLAGVTTIVRVADLLINRILTEIEQPRVRSIMTLGKGKAEVFAIKIPRDAKSIGIRIKEITQNSKFPGECVFMGIYKEKSDEFFIPRGDHMIHEDDMIFLTARKEYINQVADILTQKKFRLWPISFKK
ncbi:MAG: TrkA family potassium uptake protein [Spirochaetales bacterium]|nr:TrkA family potassium uptake protein [Spirochaetales bacterium]